jgi:protein-disulfide isomerase
MIAMSHEKPLFFRRLAAGLLAAAFLTPALTGAIAREIFRPDRILTEAERAKMAAPPAPFADHVIGSDSAPLTLISYNSLACSACGWFVQDVVPQLQRRFIDTGQVRIIFRLLLSGHDAFDAATVLVQCAPAERRIQVMQSFFSDQEGLRPIAEKPAERLFLTWRLAGRDASSFNSCMRSVAVDAAFRIDQAGRERFRINATPTLIVHDKVYTIGRTADGSDATVEDIVRLVETRLARLTLQ